ncbi:MAG: DUF4249 domain-containing protein [Bacteroidia bacterium]|nr:DUF4249 domain-containing protein [Bacteroidia bacterium]
MKYNHNIYVWGLLFLAVILNSCEDVIEVSTDPAEPIIVVEAWLDNEPRGQTIRLTQSQPYFDNSLFTPLSGASIEILSSDGKLFEFDELSEGEYLWLPLQGDSLGSIGTSLELNIEWDNRQFYASTQINRVPQIDSIAQEFEEESILGPEGVRTQFYSRDPMGTGDSFWIKTYKNGRFLDKPLELNIAYDAGFDPGARIDGLIFITPIRDLTNPVANDENSDDPPWEKDDQIQVEIHSISNEAFFFLETLRDQLSNGDNGIFSIPLSNPRGNIVDLTSNETVLGIFNVAAISRASERID